MPLNDVMEYSTNLLTSIRLLGYCTQLMARFVIKDNETIRKKVYHYIREKILNGDIAPGDGLKRKRLSHKIGTSGPPEGEDCTGLKLEKLIKS